MIFSSHDLPQSFSTCDTVCLLQKGRIAAFGRPEEIALDSEKMKTVMGFKVEKIESESAVYRFNLCK